MNFRKIALLIISLVFLAFSIALLIIADFGTDTNTFMNQALSQRFNISFGHTIALFNSLLFLIELIFGRRYIKLGTFLNMWLMGYMIEGWHTALLALPFAASYALLPVRILIFVLGITGTVFTVGIYINTDMGIAPYDALGPMLNSCFKKDHTTLTRMLFDGSCILIGVLAGKTPNLGHITLFFTLGPVISATRPLTEKLVNPEKKTHGPSDTPTGKSRLKG